MATTTTTTTYGLDIETDTTIDGLDPMVAPIVAIAIATPGGSVVIRSDADDEASAITIARAYLASLPTGTVATWNGTAFDLHFLEVRAEIVGAAWDLAGHSHIDGLLEYRASGLRASFPYLPMGLKKLARWFGLNPVEIDASRIHEYDAATIDAYVASDAEITVELVRRLP